MLHRVVFWGVAAFAVACALSSAWLLRWTCDDACISFRYAENFVAGHGLVFNLDPQEAPVEGYSNFLWTLLLALGLELGCAGDRLETWAAALGVLMHAATVALLVRTAWRSNGRLLLPIAAFGYSLHHHAASLAPAGLETAMFTLLAAAMVHRVCAVQRPADHLWLGVLGALAAMTRPDGAILCASAGLFALADGRRWRSLSPIVWQLLPLLAVFLPYLLWRHSYYGYWLPNTYYAKSGGDPYPGQGFAYVRDYGVCYLALLATVPALLLGLAQSRSGAERADAAFAHRLPWAIAAFAVPYVAFVVWVGGDFMFARFLLPVTPMLLLAFDVAMVGAPAWTAVLVAVLVGTTTIWRHDPPGLDDYLQPVSDNRAITVAPMDEAKWPGVSRADAYRAAGHYLARLWDGLPVRIAIGGGQANLAWRSGAAVAIECATGLTDAFIAHLPVADRGKVGHEKNYTHYPGYLQKRAVQFMFETSWHTGSIADAARTIVFPSQPVPAPAMLVVWDAALLAELKRRDPAVQFVDLPAALDQYIAAMPTKTRADVKKDLAALDEFYFWPGTDGVARQDPGRRAQLLAYAEGK